jgi:hypothetical protein
MNVLSEFDFLSGAGNELDKRNNSLERDGTLQGLESE